MKILQGCFFISYFKFHKFKISPFIQQRFYSFKVKNEEERIILSLLRQRQSFFEGIAKIQKLNSEKQKQILLMQAIRLCPSDINMQFLLNDIEKKNINIPINAFILNEILKRLLIDQKIYEAEIIANRYSNISDSVTYSIIINVFAKLGNMEKAEAWFEKIPQKLLNNIIYTCVLDGYCKKGEIDKAENFFKNIPSKLLDIVSYNCLLDGYCKQGDMNKAENFLKNNLFSFFNLTCVRTCC